MVNQCAVLWCGRDLWVETAHNHLPCFASCRKTTPNKQRASKPYKMAMNWAQVTRTEKATTGPSLRKYNLFLYSSCLYFYVLTTILNFSYKVVIETCGNLCTEVGRPVIPCDTRCYSRLPIIRTFKENRKKFALSGVRVIEGKII